jgi:1-piperideine-2-carboxylate/1-pyrroline-2-carboxylate reductase [NAD(P)H]
MQLDASATARKLPYSALVPAIANAARELAGGLLSAPERLSIPIGTNAALLCMPAVGPDIGITKIVTVHPQNAAHALPAIQGEVIVFDSATGRRLLLLDGPTVTARRTAAVTLLAVETLAPRRPRSALLIGTGVQSAAHAEALVDYFDVRSFVVAGTALQSAVTFCDTLRAKHQGISATPVLASKLDPAGHDTDLVIALTTARTPVVPSQLPDTTLAVGVGAFRPEMAELPAELLRQRRIVVDYLEGAHTEAGDLLQANVNWKEVRELSQVLGRDAPVLRPPFVFKSVGHASWDLAAARVALATGL